MIASVSAMIDLELRILGEVNRIRESRGLRPLGRDDVLARVARSYSRLMAEQDFFSHRAPVAGLEDVVERVRIEGGAFDGLGENLAMRPAASSSARDFVDGWTASPGHRQNLLAPDWEVSGVGVYAAGNGYVFATQLFGIPAAITLRDVRLEARPDTWYVLRFDVRIGVGYALGAFVRNRFVSSVDADPMGRAVLECEVPSVTGRHHVGLGRRRAGSRDDWIGVYDGIAEIGRNGAGVWRPAPMPDGGCVVHEDGLYRVTGSTLELALSGQARKHGILVVDGTRVSEFAPGAFETRASFRSGTGHHTVDVGLPEDDTRYRVVRRYRVDADRGELREE